MRSASWWVVAAVVLLTGGGCRQASARSSVEAEGSATVGVGSSVAWDEMDGGTAGERGRAGASLATTDVVSPSVREHKDADPGVIEIIGKVPKPEAMIFEKRADTPIEPIDVKKSFLDRIGEPVGKEQPPSDQED